MIHACKFWFAEPIPLKEERPTFHEFFFKFLKREWIEWEDFKWGRWMDLCFCTMVSKSCSMTVEGLERRALLGAGEFLFGEYLENLITRLTVPL